MKTSEIINSQNPDEIIFLSRETLLITIRRHVNEAVIDAMNAKDREDYLTQDEAAKLLHITKQTLIAYEKAGKVKSYRLGKRAMYKRSELFSFCNPTSE